MEKQKEIPIVGNFPVNQYQVETSDPETGESIFRRISNAMRYLTKGGQEIPDPRPAAPALGKKSEMHIRDYIKTLVHNERLQQELDAAGAETFEEANDFEIGDDYFPDSQYENDLEPSLAELIREGTASLSAKAAAAERAKAHRKANQVDPDDPPPEPSKKARKGRDPAPKPDQGGSDDSGLDD